MNKTTNYELNKPEGTDFYDVDDFNDNMDIIDTELAKKAEAADVQIELPVSGWSNKSQTVNVTGLTSSSRFLCGPTIASMDEVNEKGVKPTAYGSGSITFVCEELPENKLYIDITFLK